MTNFIEELKKKNPNYDTFTIRELEKLLSEKSIAVLPCRIGDTAWYIDKYKRKITPCTVEEITIQANNALLFRVSTFNDTFSIRERNIYFNYETAEKELEWGEIGI